MQTSAKSRLLAALRDGYFIHCCPATRLHKSWARLSENSSTTRYFDLWLHHPELDSFITYLGTVVRTLEHRPLRYTWCVGWYDDDYFDEQRAFDLAVSVDDDCLFLSRVAAVKCLIQYLAPTFKSCHIRVPVYPEIDAPPSTRRN